MAKKAIIAGASGLIGSKLLDLLLAKPDYSEILVLVRKKLPIENSKITQLVVDFEKLDDHVSALTGHAIFCCLGSTKKKTPDLNEYRKIDHDYPIKLAQLGKQNGVEQYHLVSALGADSHSTNFYKKMKGDTEDDLKKAGLKCLHIYQPSLLSGFRKEYRALERLAIGFMNVIDPFLFGNSKKYQTIPAQTVAQAMYNESIKIKEGLFIHRSDEIKLLV